ncbi:hypothetical protein HG530_012425 [Fusarium avenaceum]|nr:hypothetical protein HG530_012425 [Fusarium avenaceum]
MLEVQVWRSILLVSSASVERSSLVTGLLGHEFEDVGSNVPATKRVETPVGLYGGELRVVVVETVIRGSDEMLGDCIAE